MNTTPDSQRVVPGEAIYDCPACHGAGYGVEQVCCGKLGEQCCGDPDVRQVPCASCVTVARDVLARPRSDSETLQRLIVLHPDARESMQPNPPSDPRQSHRSHPPAQAQGAAKPAAWLHQVVGDDGEPDQALSFSPDNFPLEGVSGYRSLSHAPLYLGTPASSEDRRDGEEIANAIVLSVAELPDRDSPEDHPEMMLVTGDELRDIVIAAIDAAREG